jgi:superoxide reductase
MPKLTEQVQTADWKSEKHVPVIDAPESVKAGELFDVTVGLGKQVAHPNTVEHHIRWVSLYFQPDGGKFTYQVGHFEFAAHGESAKAPNEGPVCTHHAVTATLKVQVPGTLQAVALCNIHGLWESSRQIQVTG